MKKVFLINSFDNEGKYISTIQKVFSTKENAIKYREMLNTKNLLLAIFEVEIN